MFGRGLEKMQKRGLINMYLLINKIQFEYIVVQFVKTECSKQYLFAPEQHIIIYSSY